MLEKTLFVKDLSGDILDLEHDLQLQLPGGSAGFDLDNPTKYRGLGGYFNNRLTLIINSAATLINFKQFKAKVLHFEIGELLAAEPPALNWLDLLEEVIKKHARAMKMAHELLQDRGFAFVLDDSFVVANLVQRGGYQLTFGYPTTKDLEELIEDFPIALRRRIRETNNHT